MILDVDAFSDIGLKRRENQDAFFYAVEKNVGIFAVADGMGGHYRGDMASKTVIAELSDWWKKTSPFLASITFEEAIDALEKEIRRINNYVVQQYRILEQQGGTTLCIMLLHHKAYAVFNIGDSRLYCYEKHKLRQITRDDVWENSITNLPDPEKNKKDKRYGKLTKAIGIEADITPSLVSNTLGRQMVFLLCSDGVYKNLIETDLYEALKKIKKPGDAEKRNEWLRTRIYEQGASDNITVITVLAGI